jgi:hypothetical protein
MTAGAPCPACGGSPPYCPLCRNEPAKSKADELRELVADEERKQESVLSAWSGIGDENPDGLKRAKEAANGAGLAVASWATNRSNLRALLAEIEALRFSDPASLITSLELQHNADVAEIAELRAVIQRVRNAPAADVSGPVYDAGGEQLHRNLGFNKGLKYAIGLLTPKPLDEGGKYA